jgi:hypothetical protein
MQINDPRNAQMKPTVTLLLVISLAIVSGCGRSSDKLPVGNAAANAQTSDADAGFENLIVLDAEALAEGGIAQSYEALLPELRKYVKQPARVEEIKDDAVPSYAVKCGGRRFLIYGPGLKDDNAEVWPRATYAFFTIINDQLAGSDHRFYAINAGNDLGGMFLTPAGLQAFGQTLDDKQDWPYIPTEVAAKDVRP